MRIRIAIRQFFALIVSLGLITASFPPPTAALRITSTPLRKLNGFSTHTQVSRALTNYDISHSSTHRAPRLATDTAAYAPAPGAQDDSDETQIKNKIPAQLGSLNDHSLTFIENKGQFDPRVKFEASNHGRRLWLTENEIVFDFVHEKVSPSKVIKRTRAFRTTASPVQPSFQRDVIRESFIGANSMVSVEVKGAVSGAYNYFSGSDLSKWQTNVQRYSEIVYHDLWNGVDVRFYGNGSDLEQEFIVRPGASVGELQVGYQGIEKLEVAQDGSLLIQTSEGQMRETAPRIFQEIGGNRVSIDGKFRLLTPTSYTFDTVSYDRTSALIVDPTVLYSTYLGGSAGNIPSTSNQEVANAVAVDSQGNAYIAGYTLSNDFPTTAGAFATTHTPVGTYVGFVTKLNPTGSALIYSSYFNYTSFGPAGIAVDAAGNAYIAGMIGAVDGTTFPLTTTAFDSCSRSISNGTSSAFLSVLNSSGSGLLYSTCFGNIGSPGISGLAVDSNGRAFVVGYTGVPGAVPTTPTAFQGTYPGSSVSAFITEFDTTLSGTSSLVYSTYLGIPGNGSGDNASAIAIDSFGKIYVAGNTADGFPVTQGAFQTVYPRACGTGFCVPLQAFLTLQKSIQRSAGNNRSFTRHI